MKKYKFILIAIFVLANAVFLQQNVFALESENHIAEYNKVSAELEKNREEFLDKGASDLSVPNGDNLFWITYKRAKAKLHRYNPVTDEEIKYKFSIGSMDYYNYRANDKIIVTAKPEGKHVSYYVYAADHKKKKIDTLNLPAPGAGTKWHAYAVAKNNLYFIKSKFEKDEDGDLTIDYILSKWVPGSGEEHKGIISLLEAGADDMGTFQDFDIFGDDMLFIESGRLWKLDLKTKKAIWLKNKQQIRGGVNFTADKVLYTYFRKDLIFYKYDSKEIRNISDEIRKNEFSLNPTFKNNHYYWGDAVLYKNFAVYKGNGGIYAYDLEKRKIHPLLYEPRLTDNKRVTYRSPVVVNNGIMFVKALVSNSGSIGFDGPVYKVSIKKLLQQSD